MRLTSDYLVVVVADSKIRTVKDLANLMRAKQKDVPIAGGVCRRCGPRVCGGVGTWRAQQSRRAGVPAVCGGAEVVQAVLTGKAVAGVSGYSEFSEQLANGKLRAIGVSSKRVAFGMPSIRDQGIDMEMANWRGVFTGDAVTQPGAARWSKP